MKNKLILSLLVIFVIIGVYLIINTTLITNKNTSILSTTWNQLSENERMEIIGSFKDGKVKKITANKDSSTYHLSNLEYDGKKVYYVSFESKNKDISGNVEKLVDINTGNIIGYSFRE